MTKFTLFFVSMCMLLGSSTRAERSETLLVLDETAVKNLQLETSLVLREPFERTQTVLGYLDALPELQSVLSSRVPGRISAILVSEGQQVVEGRVLAHLEPLVAQSNRPPLELKAPANGRIHRLNLRLGAAVEPGEVLMEISELSKLRVVVQLPESHLARIPEVAQVRLVIPALSRELPPVALERVGDHLDSSTGLLDAFVTVENSDGQMKPGMRVVGEVILARRDAVLSVPRESVRGDSAHPVLFVKHFELPHAFIRLPVVLGSRNESRVEILSGLFEGDEVVTRGAYALSFTGTGSGSSLKEALDAAHGHEHNEDGSEIDPGESTKEEEHDHAATATGSSPPWLIGYAVVITFLSLLLGDLLRRARRRNQC